jgi:hypothetical protein
MTNNRFFSGGPIKKNYLCQPSTPLKNRAKNLQIAVLKTTACAQKYYQALAFFALDFNQFFK